MIGVKGTLADRILGQAHRPLTNQLPINAGNLGAGRYKFDFRLDEAHDVVTVGSQSHWGQHVGFQDPGNLGSRALHSITLVYKQ